MPSDELINYIKKAQSSDVPDEIIKSKLLSVGWIQEDIDNSFNQLAKEQVISIASTSGKEAIQIEQNVPTSISSGYKKDPYREPMGAGKPQAEEFIKENLPKTDSSIGRTWSVPESKTNTPQVERMGQKFTPIYKAEPMATGAQDNLIPKLEKPQASFVGTSFIPKKESQDTIGIVNKINQDVPVKNVYTPTQTQSPDMVSAFKVMPQGLSGMPTSNLPVNDYNNLLQNTTYKKSSSSFWGWLIFIIVFLGVLVGAIVYANVKGYIELPFEIPFIQSLQKQEEIQADVKDDNIEIVNTTDDSLQIEEQNIETNIVEDEMLELNIIDQ